jgi:hypothetical protein
MWFLEGVGSNCVTRGERDIYLWGVLLSRIVCKEVELGEEVERWALSSSVCPQLWRWCWQVGVRVVRLELVLESASGFPLFGEGGMVEGTIAGGCRYHTRMESTMLGRVSVAGYLKILYAWWGVEEGDLSNGLGDCLPNRDLTLGKGEIRG